MATYHYVTESQRDVWDRSGPGALMRCQMCAMDANDAPMGHIFSTDIQMTNCAITDIYKKTIPTIKKLDASDIYRESNNILSLQKDMVMYNKSYPDLDFIEKTLVILAVLNLAVLVLNVIILVAVLSL